MSTYKWIKSKSGILAAVAWVAMAGLVSTNFALERSHSNGNKAALAGVVYDTLVKGCYSGNVLRVKINERAEKFKTVVKNTDDLYAVVESFPGINPDFKMKLQRAVKQNQEAAAFTPASVRSCASAYASIRPAGHPVPPDTEK